MLVDNLIEELPRYMQDIAHTIVAKMTELDIDEISEYYFNNAMDAIQNLIVQECAINLNSMKIRALDAFDKEFIIHQKDHTYIVRDLDTIFKTKALLCENISMEEVLLHSNKRFSVVYDGLDGMFKVGSPRIIDIPTDVFRYLKEGNYDNCIIKAILDDQFLLEYNFTEAFELILKHGKNNSEKFKEKAQLLGNTKTLIQYVKNSCNPYSDAKLTKTFKEKFGDEKYSIVAKNCIKLDINLRTLLYRVTFLDTSFDDAIDIGASEYEKYGIGYTHINSDHKFKVNDAFNAFVSEKAKEQHGI